MTNKLIVDNFLIFKHIEIDINRYNVFIGPQASGKSLVAKILYLFYQFPELCYFMINQKTAKAMIKKEMVTLFESIFPKETWGHQSFKIALQTEKGLLIYRYTPKDNLVFSISKYHDTLLSSLKKLYDSEASKENEIPFSQFAKTIRSQFHAADWGLLNRGGSACFIPAGRSYFSSLNKLVFTALKNEVEIDYLVKAFGAHYERAKKIYSDSSNNKDVQKELLNGLFFIKDSKEYIHIDNNNKPFDIEVSNASSGQQELLPILLRMFSAPKAFCMIEEPEAHIYPESQYSLIRFIISRRVPDDPEMAFLFTTHSPYVLTTINNLAYAGILEKRFNAQNNKESIKKLDKVYPARERIPQGSLSAYYFDGGNVESIIDKETEIINAQKLDDISERTNDKFSELLELELSENCK